MKHVQTTETILETLRRDVRVHSLYLLPAQAEFTDSAAWMAERVFLDEDTIMNFRRRFLESGLWRQVMDAGRNSKIEISQRSLSLGGANEPDLSVADFMVLSSQVAPLIDADGPCWYQFHLIATTDQLKGEFLRKVHDALHELREKSDQVPSNTILAWQHTSVDCLKSFKLSETENL